MNRFLGRTFVSIVNKDDEEIIFTAANGATFRLYHSQDCCESVSVESIVGDLNDLVGSPILVAEESTSDRRYPPGSIEAITARLTNTEDNGNGETQTWTFYKFATIKGYVDIRWYGTSNGYYSESVNLEVIEK